MVSPEARREMERMFGERRRTPADRAPKSRDERRKEWEFEASRKPLPKGAKVREAGIDGLQAEWVEMPFAETGRTMLLLHGGGYVSGSPRTHRLLAASLARATKSRVLMPEYRLAPEHPYPAALKDALIAFRWLTGAGGVHAGNVVVAGDSAGGGLAIAMLMALRSAGAWMPRAAVLMSPWTDLSVSSPSYVQMRRRDPSITREDLIECAECYSGERSIRDPMLSPLFADLEGLPPILIHAGGEEIMLDDSRLFADRARAHGVDVTYKAWPGMWHAFQNAGPDVPEAAEAVSEIGAYVRALYAPVEPPAGVEAAGAH